MDLSVEKEQAAGEDLRSAAAHGVRWSIISRPAIELLQLISVVILARLVDPAEFGRFAIAIIAQEVAFLIVAGGVSEAPVPHRNLSRAHEETGMWLGMVTGLGLGVLVLVIASVAIDPIFGATTASYVRL